ncbi:hypothetical protein ES703_82885 [subsurface metagenome]
MLRGGICIAGMVTMSDGAPINGGEDVMVNLYHGWDEPMWVYEDGWFIMGRIGSSYYAGPGKGFVLRAFGYDPIDASITILDGEMTYLEFVMQKTSPEDLASVAGTVMDENNQPFDGARVSLKFPFANHGYRGDIGYTYPHMEMTTGVDGWYSFEGLSVAEHSVCASASGYAYHSDRFTLPAGGTAVEDRKLYPNRRIVLDYVYQADGSRSFTTGDLREGTIDWLHGEGGLDFSDGQVKGGGLGRDLNMRQIRDVLKFRNSYGCSGNGYYDAGAVDFNSVTEAAEAGYSTSEKLCLVGHVYVVKTYDELNYAKFIVKSDECSFRTVVPGDSDPIEFAGYSLIIDFSYCSDYGKVYVRKYSGAPTGIQRGVLPYYWEITGMAGLTFSADLTIAYDEADVTSLGLSEDTLVLFKSFDNGGTWVKLETQRDLSNNTLHVEGISSFSLFAISAEHTLKADLNNNGIVDFLDFAIMGSEWLETEPWYNPN